MVLCIIVEFRKNLLLTSWISLQQPSERTIIVDDLFKVEVLRSLFIFRPGSGHSRSPSVLWCLFDVTIIMVLSPGNRPALHIVPNSNVLEMKAFVPKLASVQVCTKDKISNLDKLTIECCRGCHGVNFKKNLASSDCFELVIKHDLIAILIILLFI